ncbi:MAG: methionine gamma-lyase [Anaerolinea sp.]|nr:methionine gamma-lyase [Anaerolinea sp.]
MRKSNPSHGLSTLVNHVAEGEDPTGSHVSPIFQTSTFRFPDVETGAARFKGEDHGYIYTRLSNPNSDQLAAKYAALEGWDLLKKNPDRAMDEIVGGVIFSSGMAAITSAILACVKGGQTIITHESLYGATYTFLREMAPKYGIEVIFTKGVRLEDWEEAFKKARGAALAYVETPANPTMTIIDLAGVIEIAHRHGTWLMVDNTFASPYCQRPLTFGADIVVHSTTKYLTGHGVVIGGAVVSNQMDYIRMTVPNTLKLLGGSPSPFDAWLSNLGLKTFALRMEAHCRNALAVAQFLETHPAVAQVHYPGLPGHADHALACKQMSAFGGMVSFELKGGLKAGEAMMNRVELVTLAVSLGNTDSLIMHPASMSHVGVPAEVRRQTGLSDGLVRLSVGIEEAADIIGDLDQAMRNL